MPKSISDQIKDLEATRGAKIKRLDELTEKSRNEGRSMDDAEQEEFDSTAADVERLDGDIARLKRLEGLQAKSATGVTQAPAQPAKPTGAVSTGGDPNAGLALKHTENLEKGIGFARLARVKALSQLHGKPASDVAAHLYPHDSALQAALKVKDAVSAANTIDATWAGNLILDSGATFADFVEFLRPRTLVDRVSGSLRRLPFDTPVLIQGSAGAGGWVKEGVAKPVTEWTYTKTKLTPLKVAAIAAATKETLMRASMAADMLLRDELARAVTATLDTTFIDPDAAAVTDESPASILNGVAPLTAHGDTGEVGVRCDVQTLLRAFSDENLSLAGTFWIMPERVAIALSLMQNPLGQTAFPGIGFNGGTFFGLPVFVTNYAPTDSNGSVVALVKGDEIFLGDEGGIQVSMSDQASLVLDTAPSMNSTTPTAAQVVSLWQTNSVAFLVERFMNWQRRRAQAVAWMRVNWDACTGS